MISVCIPTYNGELYIKKQMESILKQIKDNDEVIVSDDSSTDATLKILDNFNDKRIKILRNNHFHSPIYNLENALKNASGDLIFLSDQDDIWCFDKVEKILKYLKNYDCVVSDAKIIDGNDFIIADSFYKINKSKKGFLHNFIKNGYLGCTMAFTKKIKDISLPFPNKIPMHDSWIGLLSEIYGKTIFIDEQLICYRRHGNNASQSAEKSRNSLKTKIYQRIILLYAILKRILFINMKKNKGV